MGGKRIQKSRDCNGCERKIKTGETMSIIAKKGPSVGVDVFEEFGTLYEKIVMGPFRKQAEE